MALHITGEKGVRTKESWCFQSGLMYDLRHELHQAQVGGSDDTVSYAYLGVSLCRQGAPTTQPALQADALALGSPSSLPRLHASLPVRRPPDVQLALGTSERR
jgi:hypothetical protein